MTFKDDRPCRDHGIAVKEGWRNLALATGLRVGYNLFFPAVYLMLEQGFGQIMFSFVLHFLHRWTGISLSAGEPS